MYDNFDLVSSLISENSAFSSTMNILISFHLRDVVQPPSSTDHSPADQSPTSSGPPSPKRKRTLMDIVRSESSWPVYKNHSQVPFLKSYLDEFSQNQKKANELLDQYFENSRVSGPILMYDAAILLYRKVCPGVSSPNVSEMTNLLGAVQELLWYICPHQSKLSYQGAKIPEFFNPLFKINNPLRHKHKAGNLCKETSLKYIGSVTCLLEKSFCSRKSFEKLYNIFDSLVESCVKYCDYLEENLEAVNNYQSKEDIQPDKTVNELPFNERYKNSYKSNHDKSLLEIISNKLEDNDFYDPISLNEFLPPNKAYRF